MDRPEIRPRHRPVDPHTTRRKYRREYRRTNQAPDPPRIPLHRRRLIQLHLLQRRQRADPAMSRRAIRLSRLLLSHPLRRSQGRRGCLLAVHPRCRRVCPVPLLLSCPLKVRWMCLRRVRPIDRPENRALCQLTIRRAARRKRRSDHRRAIQAPDLPWIHLRRRRIIRAHHLRRRRHADPAIRRHAVRQSRHLHNLRSHRARRRRTCQALRLLLLRRKIRRQTPQLQASHLRICRRRRLLSRPRCRRLNRPLNRQASRLSSRPSRILMAKAATTESTQRRSNSSTWAKCLAEWQSASCSVLVCVGVTGADAEESSTKAPVITQPWSTRGAGNFKIQHLNT